MATATLPTIQNNASPIDNLINSVTSAASRSGTTTTTGAFNPQLGALLDQLVNGTGPYSRTQAIMDSQGALANLAQQTMSQYIPQQAAQVRGAGLYNSTAQQLLRGNADARLAAEMSALVSKNITDYATAGANQVNAVANANRTSNTTTQGGTGKGIQDALIKAGLGILGNEGKKLLGGLLGGGGKSDATDVIGDRIKEYDLAGFGSGSAAAAASGIGIAPDFSGPSAGSADPLGDFISGLGIGGSGGDVLGDDGSIGGLLGSGIDTVSEGASNALGGLGDLLGNLGGGLSDFFSNVTTGIGDFFGGFFADGGKVPIRDRGIGAVGDDRYGGGAKATASEPSSDVGNLLKQIFPNNIFDRTRRKNERDAGLETDAPAGKIPGKQSANGLDNMLIAVQGGEGILPPDVMAVPGVEELLNTLIDKFHTPVEA